MRQSLRITRSLALLFAVLPSLLGATPAAAAAAPAVSLTLVQRWHGGQPGGWTPYVASVRNDGASDFTGDVVLQPVSIGRGAPLSAWPDYRGRVTVPGGATRSLTFYVVEPPAGYQAALVDAAGRTVANGVTVTGLADGGYMVAVLSDQPQAASAIEALKPLTSSSGFGQNAGVHVTRFASAQDFPTSAVFLTGLAAVVVDDFDVSTLSDAQVRALHDFVGLGGSLVVAGGSAWRRTLLPLFQKGFPGVNPSRTGEAALQPLGDLNGQAAAMTAPIAIGDTGSGRVLLGAPGGPPLAVEAGYGGGRVVDLLFDPLADPIVNDNTGLPAVAWNLALARAVAETAPAAAPGTPIAVGVPVKTVAPGPPTADGIVSILMATPAAAVPPVGLIGVLLVVYVLIAGPLNYLALRGFRRRELMWISVPLVALVFTGAAYVAGAGVHGSNYLDNEVQLLTVAPDGVAEVHAYHGLYPPRRGNFTVVVAANTLASTALGSSFSSTPEAAVVNTTGRTQVELLDSSYGNYRSLQTMAIARPPGTPALALEAHLRIAQGRVLGTVRNSGDRAVQALTLVSGVGQAAKIADDLEPRATVTVDAQISTAGNANNFAGPPTVASAGSKRAALARIVQGAAAGGRPGSWSLTGLTDPSGEVTIDGLRPAHSGLAALIEPVSLESVDNLSLAPRASLVMSGQSVPYHYDVVDLAIPDGYSGAVKLAFEGNVGVGLRSLEVYDWDAGTWRAVTPRAGTNGRAAPTALNPGEARGTVRVRVSEQSDAALSTLSLVAS